MPISINNAPSISLPIARDSVSVGLERVSSGSRINSAIDDAAGIAIASRFTREINALGVASRNAGDGISLVQVADGALNSVSSNLQRIRELALSSANGTLTDQDREGLAAEANQLREENANILENTSFNGRALLNNDDDFSFQIGPNGGDEVAVQGNNLAQALDDLGLNDIDISTQAGASQALSVLDEASEQVNEQSSEFGAAANRFESTIESLNQTRENESAARSRVEDADLARELADISAGLVQEQADIAVQAQANSQSNFVLQLLQ